MNKQLKQPLTQIRSAIADYLTRQNTSSPLNPHDVIASIISYLGVASSLAARPSGDGQGEEKNGNNQES